MPPRPTLRDVAQAAGVHPATVSRVLTPETRHLVNDGTAARIETIIAEIGYRPNAMARGLRTQTSRIVGALIPDLTNPLFPPLIRGIEDRLAAAGYMALVVNTDNDRDRESEAFQALREHQVDGFISATAAAGDDTIPKLVREGVPVVLMNRDLDDFDLPAVVPDDRAGIELAVELVVSLGHRRIAHLGGPAELSSAHTRNESFERSLRKHGLTAEAAHVVAGRGMTVEEGQRLGAQLLGTAQPPTAIVAANDMLAVGIYAAAAELGLSIPGDLSVVGFNDMPFADRFQPPLTTVRIPHHEMGAQAASLLLSLIKEGSVEPRRVVMDVQLVERGSTAPAPS